jgi:alpha,alpha-trehalase
MINHFVERLRRNVNRVRAELAPRHRSPEYLLGDLLQDVQFRQLYPDSMEFVDMVPTRQLNQILKAYKEHRHEPGFDIATFIKRYFKVPTLHENYATNPEHSIEEHIDELWDVLTRNEHHGRGSLIGLPHPYIVAGGRFRAMFYWDSYFIMLGLATSGRWEMLEGMVKNFAFLLRRFGHIPNGNRTYYVGRSQPPFFALMLQLLAKHKGKRILVQYLPYLLLEHHFWIKGSSKLAETRIASRRVVRMPDGEILNRYYDNKSTPRPEGYREDVSTVLAAGERLPSKIHLDLRAAAESGWDFSSRWCKEPQQLHTIHTTDIVPVDLNCLLYILEKTIAETHKTLHSPLAAKRYEELARRRAEAINKYMWSEKHGIYMDYDVVVGDHTQVLNLGGVLPLYAGVASQEQADKVADSLKKSFLKPGGLLTTLIHTGQQWDAPNGWAPLQWMAIRGLRAYGHNELADTIKKRWINTVKELYKNSGKLVEKYNVVDIGQIAGGGEYPLQDGFGWTNGVLIAMLHEDELPWN